MRIAIASDHAGFKYKQLIARHLADVGDEVKDFGTFSEDPVDYPDFIRPAAEAVARGEYERGVVLGGSGNGEAMAANRVKGVRCAYCFNEETARLGQCTTTPTSSPSANASSPRKWRSRSSTPGSKRPLKAAATCGEYKSWTSDLQPPDVKAAIHVDSLARAERKLAGGEHRDGSRDVFGLPPAADWRQAVSNQPVVFLFYRRGHIAGDHARADLVDVDFGAPPAGPPATTSSFAWPTWRCNNPRGSWRRHTPRSTRH